MRLVRWFQPFKDGDKLLLVKVDPKSVEEALAAEKQGASPSAKQKGLVRRPPASRMQISIW